MQFHPNPQNLRAKPNLKPVSCCPGWPHHRVVPIIRSPDTSWFIVELMTQRRYFNKRTFCLTDQFFDRPSDSKIIKDCYFQDFVWYEWKYGTTLSLCSTLYSVTFPFRRKWALSLPLPTFWRTWSPSLPTPSSWPLRASMELGRTPTSCPSIRRRPVGPSCKNWVWMWICQKERGFHFDNARRWSTITINSRCSFNIWKTAQCLLITCIVKKEPCRSWALTDLRFGYYSKVLINDNENI